MSLSEQFRPKSLKDMMGNEQGIRDFENAVLGNQVPLLFGGAGTGKTTAPHAIARDLGFQIIEWNGSDKRKKEDMEQILRQIQCKNPFNAKGKLFFLDEIDECDDYKTLALIIKKHKHPLVLACNELHKIPPQIQQLCVKVRFWAPHISEVTQYILKIEKATGLKANLSGITTDFRSSINNCFNHGTHYVPVTPFDEIDAFYRKQQINQLTDEHYTWLIDNNMAYYSGKTLIEAYLLLDACDRLKSFKPLRALPRGKMGVKCEYPRYLTRIKQFKEQKQKSEK